MQNGGCRKNYPFNYQPSHRIIVALILSIAFVVFSHLLLVAQLISVLIIHRTELDKKSHHPAYQHLVEFGVVSSYISYLA
jgi:hypothetical protein